METSPFFFGSLTRIARLDTVDFRVKPVPRNGWATGDYVVGAVVNRASTANRIENEIGRMIEVAGGDEIVGALGVRRATLEYVGDWRGIEDDHLMQALTSAGLFGRLTSRSLLMPPLLTLRYLGHVQLAGRKVGMRDFVEPVAERPLTAPVVLIIGTSMSAGKTSAARAIVRQLKALGLRVVGAKLTGAGRYRDILAMADAGADRVFDFVDVGLPSTVCPADEYGDALRQLLSMIESSDRDVVVAEAGASPLEPYNGSVAIDAIRSNVRCTVLCASDPYAVLGLMEAHRLRPDLVTGVATSTEAGTELAQRLSGVQALNLLAAPSLPRLREILARRLELAGRDERSGSEA